LTSSRWAWKTRNPPATVITTTTTAARVRIATERLILRASNRSITGSSKYARISATPTGTSYKDTTVAANSSYTYRVRATDSSGKAFNATAGRAEATRRTLKR